MKVLRLGMECKANDGLYGWGQRKVTRLWLTRSGRITADCPEKGKIVYSVLGLHVDENGHGVGWGTVFESLNLAKAKNWMREHGDTENAYPV